MIAKLVSFQLPLDMSRDEVLQAAREAAHEWLKHPKLVRKDFLLDDNNMTYGYYLFPDRESAEQAHDENFMKQLQDRFGVKPQMKYFDYLLTADTVNGNITGDA
jgi:hypothetical protein